MKLLRYFLKKRRNLTFWKEKWGKKNPSGKLFSRWANVIKLENKANSVTQEAHEDVFDDKVLEKKCWLAHNCTPWEKVKKFCVDTCTFRNKCKGSLSDLLADWPRYNDFNGYELVDIDFNAMLDKFYKVILPILNAEVKDQASRELLLSKLLYKDDDLSNNSKYCIVLLLLHAVLQPQRQSKTHKPTIGDAQSEFITLATTPNDILPKISSKIEQYAIKKQQLQPHIIAVGEDYTSISEFFIFCDGLKWKCPILMKCVDCIIKLSYVFQIEYSHNSKQVIFRTILFWA